MRVKPVSDFDKKKIVSLYTTRNQTLKEIAERYPNFSRTVVRRVLAEAGVTLRPKKPRVVHKRKAVWDSVDQVVDLYTEKGYSMRRIAAYFGVSMQPIREILKKEKIQRRTLTEAWKYRRKQTLPPQTHRILELRELDETIQDIAEQVGLATSEVYRILVDADALISNPKPKWER